jgi:hypothetical protein
MGRKSHVPLGERSRPQHCIALSCVHVIRSAWANTMKSDEASDHQLGLLLSSGQVLPY